MYIVHEHKNVIALDKVDCKLSCRGTTDEIDEKCHTELSDKGVKRASYCALKKQNPHCKFLPNENYDDWELHGPWRENLHYLWKRAVRITKKSYVCCR